MSSRKGLKLLAVVIVSFAILGIVGWRSLPPPTSPPTTIQVTPTVTMVTGSQTIVAPQRQTEWIKIGQVKPMSHYLSLLESNGTSPYGQLYWELRNLPNLTNATAVAKITYLALNATNPEVREAFELMIKGGTPDQADFKYSVPNYNTELQVLYWLACQNEFKKDDTLALAVAMVNGLWVTIGEDQVRQAVRTDANNILVFLRETNELQNQKGFPQLETFPLEGKLALAWTGNECTAGFGETRPHRLFDYTRKKLGLNGYRWNTVEIETLRQMRSMMVEKGWIDQSVDKIVSNMEYYFYFNRGLGSSTHWNFTAPVRPGAKEEYVVIDGENVLNHGHQNVDFLFRYYIEHDMGVGDCLDEEAFVDAWCKSCGIATTGMWLNPKSEGEYAHTYITYYEPASRSWRAYDGQLRIMQVDCFIDIYKLPVIQRNFLWTGALKENPNRWDGGMVYIIKNLPISEFRSQFSVGVPTSQMKQWLLYS